MNTRDLLNKFEACMVLHSVGDTIGYKNGDWEFNKGNLKANHNMSNEILFEFIALGGINHVNYDGWVASDDTVMHMATARALIKMKKSKHIIDELGPILANEYITSFDDMKGRSPGGSTTQSIDLLKSGTAWNDMPPASPGTGGGNGAAMRASCIGLVFKDDLDKLIEVSIESARITHNSATGILGALAVSYIISLAINKVLFTTWGFKLLELLESGKIEKYLEQTRGLKEYNRDKKFFISMWKKFIQGRFVGKTPIFEKSKMNPAYRTKYYADNFSFPTQSFLFPGLGGHDIIIIAYDAFIDACYPDPCWEKLVIYSCLHAGDSDSTGAVACSLWGAYFGFNDVPESNYKYLEFKDELFNLGKQLYEI